MQAGVQVWDFCSAYRYSGSLGPSSLKALSSGLPNSPTQGRSITPTCTQVTHNVYAFDDRPLTRSVQAVAVGCTPEQNGQNPVYSALRQGMVPVKKLLLPGVGLTQPTGHVVLSVATAIALSVTP